MFTAYFSFPAKMERLVIGYDYRTAQAVREMYKAVYEHEHTQARLSLKSVAVEVMLARASRVQYVVYKGQKVHARKKQAATRTVVWNDRKGRIARRCKALPRAVRAGKRTIVWKESAFSRSEQNKMTLHVARFRLELSRRMSAETLKMRAAEKEFNEKWVAWMLLGAYE
jgi:hypothetical protein